MKIKLLVAVVWCIMFFLKIQFQDGFIRQRYSSIVPVGCCFRLLFVYQLGDFLFHFQNIRINVA